MNKNYTFWIVGAIVVIIIGFVLFMQGPSSTSTTSTTSTDVTDITDTTGTNDSSGSATTGTASRPIVVTTGFASVSTTTAVVIGTVNPKGAQTNYWFEYGPTLSLGSSASAVLLSASYQTLGAAGYITGLKPSTTYYFRLGAKNAYGTVYGAAYSFITSAK